mgnify:CR=1 FL=1
MMTETAFKSLCINMFIFTSTRILGMVSLLFLLISGGFFIVGYLAISISRSIENIIRELAEDENYIDFKKNIRDTMEELSIQIHSCINSLYTLSYKVDYSTVKIKKEQIDSDTDDDMPPLIEIIQNNLLHDSDQEDTDDDMPPLIEITQNNLLHDFEQEEVDDDTASNDDELKVNPVPHCYNLRVKASNNFDNFVRPTPRVGLSYSEEQKQKEEEEEQEQEQEQEQEEEEEEEDEGDGARFGDIINKDEESDEEVVILEVEKKKNEIINLIESDDEDEEEA